MKDCPCCRGQWNALAWSKSGMTYLLCEEHKEEARAERRLKAEFARIRRLMFTGVKMDERPAAARSPSRTERGTDD